MSAFEQASSTTLAAAAHSIVAAVQMHANESNAEHAQKYFKTGPGEYGEGDQFIGVRMPVLRKLAKQFVSVEHEAVLACLHHPVHEIRMVALIIWTLQYPKANEAQQARIYADYLAHTNYINNWDLVDCSAHKIVGKHLHGRDRRVLFKLAESALLWDRRVSIISTFHFVRHGDLDTSYALAAALLQDDEDLMHKAVGWVLRECGKRDKQRLIEFLADHYQHLARTTLRYAIERFTPEQRKLFLRGEFIDN